MVTFNRREVSRYNREVMFSCLISFLVPTVYTLHYTTVQYTYMYCPLITSHLHLPFGQLWELRLDAAAREHGLPSSEVLLEGLAQVSHNLLLIYTIMWSCLEPAWRDEMRRDGHLTLLTYRSAWWWTVARCNGSRCTSRVRSLRCVRSPFIITRCVASRCRTRDRSTASRFRLTPIPASCRADSSQSP